MRDVLLQSCRYPIDFDRYRLKSQTVLERTEQRHIEADHNLNKAKTLPFFSPLSLYIFLPYGKNIEENW